MSSYAKGNVEVMGPL